jgi:hypothetical protein
MQHFNRPAQRRIDEISEPDRAGRIDEYDGAVHPPLHIFANIK